MITLWELYLGRQDKIYEGEIWIYRFYVFFYFKTNFIFMVLAYLLAFSVIRSIGILYKEYVPYRVKLTWHHGPVESAILQCPQQM